MPAQPNPTVADIQTALSREPGFGPETQAYNDSKDIVVKLLDVFTPVSLDQPVTFVGLCQWRATFLHYVLREGFGSNPEASLLRSICVQRIEGLRMCASNPEVAFQRVGLMVESRMMVSIYVGLNDYLQKRYLTGELTYREIILHQPSLFLPG